MMGVVKKILKRPPVVNKLPSPGIDGDLLNQSAELLKSTTMEMTKVAGDTISAIGCKKAQKEEDVRNNERVMACFNIFNTASDAVAILNNLGVILFCNDAFLRIFEKNDFPDVINTGIEEVTGASVFGSLNRYGIWTGDIHGKDSVVMPIRNGSPESVYYICTLR